MPLEVENKYVYRTHLGYIKKKTSTGMPWEAGGAAQDAMAAAAAESQTRAASRWGLAKNVIAAQRVVRKLGGGGRRSLFKYTDSTSTACLQVRVTEVRSPGLPIRPTRRRRRRR